MSASLDRIRDAHLRGAEPESVTSEDVEREALTREGIRPGMIGDITLFRAYLRWLNLLDPMDAMFTDGDVVRRARRCRSTAAPTPRPRPHHRATS